MPRQGARKGEKGISRRIYSRCESAGVFESHAFSRNYRVAQYFQWLEHEGVGAIGWGNGMGECRGGETSWTGRTIRS